ncbi:helix-turn-helix domain-containing protein [Mycobacterium sherrisii]|uniref:helix-turn-helix domain-containing protein n=1 Tax=Mycobacterium sherrisii TaxID=243061 RepID=UPI002DDDB073|nr:helix-turn-helix domain-containing protein [Mycobacterium sherrisii]MEC4763361.1 helix-turn-helix domain-containing protein [Mycobacterium sherrisii]
MNPVGIGPVSGVLVDADDAAYLCRALELLPKLFAAQGSRPTPRLEAVTDRLRKAVAAARKTDAHTRPTAAHADWDDDMAYELLDSDAAAALLGCTPGNVRDLARRRSLPGRRVGGRWVFERTAVERRAAAR